MNHLVRDLWKIGTADDVIHFVLTGNHLCRSRRGEVGTENEFVFHSIFPGRHECLVMPKRTIVQSGNVRVQIRVLADQHDTFSFPGMSHVGDDDPQVRARHGDILQLNRVGVLQRSWSDERCPLMDVDWDTQRLGLLEQRQVFRILGIPVLINRRTLQTAQSQIVDIVVQLLDAVRIVGIDRAPADETVRVLMDKLGDQFLVCVDATEWRLDAKHNHLVRFGCGVQKLFWPRIKRVGLRSVAARKIDVRRELHLRTLGLPRELNEFIGKMFRVPHQVGMGIKQHV